MKKYFWIFCLISLFANVDAVDQKIRDDLRGHRYAPNSAMGTIAGDIGKLVTDNQLEQSWGNTFTNTVNGQSHGFAKRRVNQEDLKFIVPALAAIAVKNPKRDMWGDLNNTGITTPEQQEHILNAYAIITLFQKLNENGMLTQGTMEHDVYKELFDFSLNEALDQTFSKGRFGVLRDKISAFLTTHILPLTGYISAIPEPTPSHYKNIHDFHRSFNPNALDGFKADRMSSFQPGASGSSGKAPAQAKSGSSFTVDGGAIFLDMKKLDINKALEQYRLNTSEFVKDTPDKAIERIFDGFLKPERGDMDPGKYGPMVHALRAEFIRDFSDLTGSPQGSSASLLPPAPRVDERKPVAEPVLPRPSLVTPLRAEDTYRAADLFLYQTGRLLPLGNEVIFGHSTEHLEGLDADRQKYAAQLSDGAFINFFIYWRDLVVSNLKAKGLPVHAYFDVYTNHIVLENISREQDTDKYDEDFRRAKSIADKGIAWTKAAQFTVGHWVTVSVSKQQNGQYLITTWNSISGASKIQDDENVAVLQGMFERANGLPSQNINTQTVQLGHQTSNDSCGIWVLDVVKVLTETGTYSSKYRDVIRKAEQEADTIDTLMAYTNLRKLGQPFSDASIEQEIQDIRRLRHQVVTFEPRVYGQLNGETTPEYLERLIVTIKKEFNNNSDVPEFIDAIQHEIQSIAVFDPKQYDVIIKRLEDKNHPNPKYKNALHALRDIKDQLIATIRDVKNAINDEATRVLYLSELIKNPAIKKQMMNTLPVKITIKSTDTDERIAESIADVTKNIYQGMQNPNLGEIRQLLETLYHYLQGKRIANKEMVTAYVQNILTNLNANSVVQFLALGSKDNPVARYALNGLDDDLSLAPMFSFSTIQKLLQRYYTLPNSYPYFQLTSPLFDDIKLHPPVIAVPVQAAVFDVSSLSTSVDDGLPNISDILTGEQKVNFNARFIGDIYDGNSLKTAIGSSLSTANKREALSLEQSTKLEAYALAYLHSMNVNLGIDGKIVW